MLKILSAILLITIPYYSYSQENAVIYGKSNNEDLKTVDISRFPSFTTLIGNELIVRAAKKEEVFSLTVKLEKPELLVFEIKGTYREVYVTPGDSIRFMIDINGSNKMVTFYGKNEANYNLLNELSEVLNRRDSLPRYIKYNDPVKFKKAVENWTFKQKDFIKTYTLKNKITPEFNKLLQEKIDYEYATLLYSSLNDNKINSESIPKDYLKTADLLSFNRDDLLPLDNYRYALRTKYVYNYTKVQKSNFEPAYQNALKVTRGKTRDLLISTLIGLYAQKQVMKDSAMLRKAINDAQKTISEPTYLSYIKKSSDQYFTINKKIPDYILDTSIFTTYIADKKTTLRDLLKSYEGKAVYIDLWASWCAPCRFDIANSSKTKSWLLSKNVAYLYFSIDKDPENWLKAVAEDNIKEDQYLAKGSLSSALMKYLDVRYIPRYILLNDKHQIVNLFSPRPHDNNLQQLSNTINGLTAKAVTFN